jgi:hypothetical protein
MTSGILSLLGVDMGSKGTPKVSNVRGHFEDSDILKLNIKILQYNNSSWDKPPIKNEIKANPSLKREAKKLILKKSNLLWGFKDPRTVFTLEHYLSYLKNPYIIFVHRNSNDVAKSLYQRNGISIKQGENLIKKYENKILQIIKDTKSLPQLFINYEDFVNNPIIEAEKIANFIDVDICNKQRKKIRRFVLSPRKRKIVKNYLQIKKIIELTIKKIMSF